MEKNKGVLEDFFNNNGPLDLYEVFPFIPPNLNFEEPTKISKDIEIYEPIYFTREVIINVINYYIDGMYINDISAIMELRDYDVNNILNHYLPYL